MYTAEEIRSVHLELTTRCNAACPQCSRNIRGGETNPRLPLVHLSLAEVQTLLPEDFLRQLSRVSLCGNYGDPSAAPEAAEIVAYLRNTAPAVQLDFATNGGARDVGFWEKLASSLSCCYFGIDGLEDTNHLYRKGVRWSTLMRNVEAYLAAGGIASWEYLVFQHNEHQVDTARQLSEELGFQQFNVKRTRRFFQASTGKTLPSLPVLTRNGEVEYTISPSSLPEYQNPAVAVLTEIVQQRGYDSYLATTPISCKATREQAIYISAEGLVLPCCYLAHLYQSTQTVGSRQVEQLAEQASGGRMSLNGLQRSLPEILGDRYFTEVVPAGWAPDDGTGRRTQTCARMCGELNLFGAQYDPGKKDRADRMP